MEIDNISFCKTNHSTSPFAIFLPFGKEIAEYAGILDALAFNLMLCLLIVVLTVLIRSISECVAQVRSDKEGW